MVKAINTHIDNADVCEKGCCILNNMMKSNSSKKTFDKTNDTNITEQLKAK